jgi:DNA-binding transcriptional regulator GbsR (MarR family)
VVRDEQALRDYAERSASLLVGAGFPRMPARVLMALMVAETGLTALQLAERLDASAAAISGAVRYLQTVAMVTRVPQQGSRRDLYELPQNAWYSASMSENRLYDAILSLSLPAIDVAGGADSIAGARIHEMTEFFRFIQRRLPELLAEWDQRKLDGS